MSDPENTFRALQDKPLFVDRWQCRFGWHRWSTWTDPKKERGDLYYRHHRFCVDCNQVQVQKVYVPL
jgi:hypothetical protein